MLSDDLREQRQVAACVGIGAAESRRVRGIGRKRVEPIQRGQTFFREAVLPVARLQ